MANNTWFFSDPHYGHKNICRGVSEWENKDNLQRVRDFDTVEEMNDALVTSLNACIKENDEAWCLGDWSFGGFPNIIEFRRKLNCKNIHLIFGNHDQHIESNREGVQGYFKSTQYVKNLSYEIDSMKSGKYGKTKIFLSHYSHQVWSQHHDGVLHLFGHSHGTLKGVGKSMDVGVDTNNLYPYHLDEIINIMRGKSIQFIDHHDISTN